jgi:hypothetical protein
MRQIVHPSVKGSLISAKHKQYNVTAIVWCITHHKTQTTHKVRHHLEANSMEASCQGTEAGHDLWAAAICSNNYGYFGSYCYLIHRPQLP